MTDTKEKNTETNKLKTKKINTKLINKNESNIKKSTTLSNNKKASEEDKAKQLTPGQKLLKTMTAQKAAKLALMKGVKNTHVSFDDEGNEEKVETVVQMTKKDRPAMKKPEPMKNKRKKEEKEKEEEKEKKMPKKAKKPKTKATNNEIATKKDTKQEEALAYVRLFVNDRSSWKFKKVLQIWLLQHLYEIPESEFDNVLKYLKDLQGSAREKAIKEAEGKIPVKKEATISHHLTGYSTVNNNDNSMDDDFDAEKLLAQAMSAPLPKAEEEETTETKRARLILETLL
ncbi:uncharacterized protein BX663DRAFT_494021 [Cokeromyces recurvatus]|uniref:uncharacterized protein n=1 Tax=Cokeromyces recurvatus TaxID=90255 RepID=UPI00221EDC12|nr:uncharacterized protein BX663DRAFT_494021 [Cokeromyces recurvatus]KAI7906862.1 hypothetical protein BX663DRAFT_494021 [Cokeromyces recurvatus]